jgi:multidrug efflux pump subunit AcrB
MNPIEFALRRPITVLVLIVTLVAGGWLAVRRMKVDIFPALDLPVVYVAQPYGGMDPSQMEGLIANYYEYHFLYINGIHHVESKNVQGVSLMKLFFHPGTDMAQAMAETVGYVDRSRAFMPPGTVPPFIMRFDTGSVPVGYLVLSSETMSIGEIQDQALFKVRPRFANIPGVSAPPPFGGSQRTIVVRADPARMKSCNLSADDVVRALASGNTISPSGNIRTTTAMPLVPSNAMVIKPEELGKIAVKPGVFLRDLVRRDPVSEKPLIEDATDIPTGYALVNGKRAVYILVTKRADASTLTVVNNVRADLPKMKEGLPTGIDVRFEFDQSPYVTTSIQDVGFESALAAVLVGLMVLVFLRDWRSVLVVVLNIPLALVGALVALSLTGQTINLMTLGGLALAVGILVDESTVEVENIHRQMEESDSIALAVRRGNSETAVPRLLAMLCILAVFIPSFFMQGSARGLFVPLSLAVGFAMITSYFLSSTFVPVLSVYLLRNYGRSRLPGGTSATGPARQAGPTAIQQGWFAGTFGRVLGLTIELRWVIVPGYLCAALVVTYFLGRQLGTEIFPQVDTGQFQFRLRAPPGTRIEQTEEITREALDFIGKAVGPENVNITLGYIGVVPPNYPINSVYLWMGGPEEAVMRVALKRGVVPIEDLKRRLRDDLPDHLRRWVKQKWIAEGEPQDKVERQVENLQLSFEPADIVNEVMSFGSPTPIEVIVSGNKMADNRTFAENLQECLRAIPSIRDLQYGQSLDYPTISVQIDREKASFSDVTTDDAARSLVATTSSSRYVVPNFWRDPASGVGYQVQVEVPQALMRSAKDVRGVPIKSNVHEGGVPVQLGYVAEVTEGTMPGQVDRYNMRRLVSMTANIEGEDLGRVAEHIAGAIAAAGKPPAGVEVLVRGQVAPMREMFQGLAFGLGVAVLVIFLLLTGYFQSVRLALTAVAAVPAVLCGVVLTLLATRTTLNIQSFMGSIMAIGVAVANAILLVTFAERYRREGKSAVEAAVEGARTRVRAITMTSLAMIAGMIPMALGLGEGGDQTAPLGRAVIGGLLASTVATLTLLPAVFALAMGRSSTASVSLSPTDPESRYYVPNSEELDPRITHGHHREGHIQS